MNKFIKDYQVNVAGAQNGVAIPTGFRIVITKAHINRKEDDSGYELFVEICTFETSDYTKPVLANDAFPTDGATMDLGATNPTSAPKTLVANNFNALLDAAYGSGNWAADPA